METLNQANKADGGKSNPVLLEHNLVDALEAVNMTLDYGFEKYVNPADALAKIADPGWRAVEPLRYEAAAGRHRRARIKGQLFDPESGLLHRAQEIVNLMFLLQLEIESEFPDGLPPYKTPPHVWDTKK